MSTDTSAAMCPHCHHTSAEQPARMNTATAAEYCGLAASTLRTWRHTGKGPRSYSLGTKVIYDRADLDDWLTSERAASVRGGAE